MSSDSYSVIQSIASSTAQNFLATIIKVEGSAYRKEGTMMLFAEGGGETGLLSGGCVEADILARIEMDQTASHVIYDMRSEDDLSWGQGVGCDGKIYIMVEPVTMETRQIFQKIQHHLNNGENVELIKKFNQLNKQMENKISVEAKKEYPNGTSFISEFICSPSDMISFTQSFEPQPKLILYGAGPDAKPVVHFASKAGFYVILADWRQSYCKKENIPYAKEYIIGSPTEVMKAINPTENDYVLTMTHSFMKDQEIVDYFQARKTKYLGLLGSKKRSERLLAEKKDKDWIRYPVGLAIHSESPEEIAISIVAELIQLKNTKKSEAMVKQ